jgi:hypothetical protein
MRRAWKLALAVGAVAVLANPMAEACGDKLLSIARGIRLQQAYKARHPATIVMYVTDAGNGGAAHNDAALIQMSLLYMSLRQAGHRISAAGNASELAEALRGHVDFLITEIGDAPAVGEAMRAEHAPGSLQPVATGPKPPTLVPVLFKPSKSDLAAARQKYGLALKTPAGSTEHLEAIDQAMKDRSGRTASGI